MMLPKHARLRTGAIVLGLGLALTMVFLAYLNPVLMVRMADAVWACF